MMGGFLSGGLCPWGFCPVPNWPAFSSLHNNTQIFLFVSEQFMKDTIWIVDTAVGFYEATNEMHVGSLIIHLSEGFQMEGRQVGIVNHELLSLMMVKH
jgi:hypothetical protein